VYPPLKEERGRERGDSPLSLSQTPFSPSLRSTICNPGHPPSNENAPDFKRRTCPILHYRMSTYIFVNVSSQVILKRYQYYFPSLIIGFSGYHFIVKIQLLITFPVFDARTVNTSFAGEGKLDRVASCPAEGVNDEITTQPLSSVHRQLLRSH